MQRPNVPRQNPEAKIQDSIVAFLRLRGWTVMQTHGNMFQQGFPDLYCLHPVYGAKWVEVKNPKRFTFTPAQRAYFPLVNAAGHGIWVLVAATEEEYAKLFRDPNWFTYLYMPQG